MSERDWQSLRNLVRSATANGPVPAGPASTSQESYLKASNTEMGSFNDGFGFAVAADGDTVAVGAIYEDSNAPGVNGDEADNSALSAGAVYVFVRDGGTWSQQAYIKASNPDAGDSFGFALDLDGDTLVVSADGEASNATGVNGDQNDNSAANSGAVYVFTRSGTSWTQQAYLKASNTDVGDGFGDSVSIDGDTLVVGADAEASSASGVDGDQANNDLNRAGAAYVFTRSGSTWSQQAYLKASNPDPFDFFGESVAISGDTVIVGASGESSTARVVNGDQNNAGGSNGAAYVFTRTDGSWSQQAYLKASNSDDGDAFGEHVAIDGDTAVVTGGGESSNAAGVNGDEANNDLSGAGAAYVFTRDGGIWSQQAYLKASNPDEFDNLGGFDGGLDIDGNRLVVTTRYESSAATGIDGNEADDSAILAGAAYYFQRTGSTWAQAAYIKASNAEAFDEFGSAAALSGDLLFIGAEFEASNATGVDGDSADNSAARAGAGYVFRLPPDFAIGGTVSGLTGTGLILQLNGGDDLPIAAAGPFQFPTALFGGNGYVVTVIAQPEGQTCGVGNGSGIVAGSDVDDIIVNCTTNTFTVGGTLSQVGGFGLVLQNNGGDDLALNGNGPFVFATALLDGAPYEVTVLTNPPGRSCTVTNGSGTIDDADVTDVTVTCAAASYSVGGTVSGLTGAGLTLQNNAGDDLTINADGPFTFATELLDGAGYEVTVATQPGGQTCAVTNGSGTIADADVTDIVVTCAADSYTIGGTVSGLTGTVVLQNNGGDDLIVNSSGPFTFATSLPDGSGYDVTVLTQPAGQSCAVSGGSGTIAGSNATNVTVDCATATFTVGGTVAGLTGTLILQNSGGDDLVVDANGPFQFPMALPDGSGYSVTVASQPEAQNCLVSRSRGLIAGADVTDVAVGCRRSRVPNTQGGLPGPEEPGARYGAAVAIDGDRIVIGQARIDVRGEVDAYSDFLDLVADFVSGLAPDLRQSGGTGGDLSGLLASITQEIITLPEEVPSATTFGASVALDGDRLIVGVPAGMTVRTRGGLAAIQAAVYERTQAGWSYRLGLSSPSSEGGDDFGVSVAVDGDLLLIGAPVDDDGGSVYAYEYDGSNVVDQLQIVNPTGMVGAKFGQALAANDGNVAVGAPGSQLAGVISGAATLYQQVAGNLGGIVAVGTVTGSGAQDGGQFGTSISLLGTTMAVGAPGEDGGAAGAGAAYTFDFSGATITEDNRVVSPEAQAGAGFGTTVALSTGGFAFGAPEAFDGEGRVYRFDPTFTTVQALEPAPGVSGFGGSLAAQGDLTVIGAPDSNAEAGAAFLAVDLEVVFRSSFEEPPPEG